jgi:hypothetical protein
MMMPPYKFVKPMKAKAFLPDQLATLKTHEWVAELKHNGHRVYLCREGMFSSIGKWYTPEMEGFAALACPGMPDGLLIDGELRAADGPSDNAVVGHLRSAAPEKLVFVAFDVLYVNGDDVMPCDWNARRMMLEQVMQGLDPQWFKMSGLYLGEYGVILAKLLADAEEGMILKRRDSPYKPGSRSNWLKVKGTVTYDVVITDCDAKPTEWRVRPGEVGKDGVLYPEGRHSDPWLAGHVGLSYGWFDVKTGQLVRVGSLGETGPREKMEQYVGRVAEVKCYGKPWPTGCMNHPVLLHWRDNKSPEDCLFDFDAGMPVEDM